jgi:hypothetical protein
MHKMTGFVCMMIYMIVHVSLNPSTCPNTDTKGLRVRDLSLLVGCEAVGASVRFDDTCASLRGVTTPTTRGVSAAELRGLAARDTRGVRVLARRLRSILRCDVDKTGSADGGSLS